MRSSLKKFGLFLLNTEVIMPLVGAVVFIPTLIGGRLLFGQEYGLIVGGVCGFVLAVLAARAVAKRLPYGQAKDLQ